MLADVFFYGRIICRAVLEHGFRQCLSGLPAYYDDLATVSMYLRVTARIWTC